MRLIINSYLKTFLKTWVSTVGILLFIILLGAVVLGMMTTPLQLSIHVNKIKAQTTQYNSQIRDAKPYTDDFSYHYFLLNGDKYTTETKGTTVLSPTPNFTPLASDQLQSALDNWKQGNNLDQPTFLSKSSYLAIDEAMVDFLKNSHDVPTGLEGKSWMEILSLETSNFELSPSAKQYIEDLKTNLGLLINGIFYAGQTSANINLKMEITLKDSPTKNQTIDLVIKDLKNNLQVKIQNKNYFSNVQQLYIANSFLKVNSKNQVSPITSLDELTADKFQDQETLLITGIITMDAHFRELIIQQQNNVNAFLLDNIFHNENNKNSLNKNGQLAYSLATSVEYNLTRSKPGLLTPELSFDVRTATMTQDFDQLILETGNLPTWTNVNSPQVVVSSGFVKANDLVLGDYLTLPGSSFGQNISQKNDPWSWSVGNQLKVKIVGTGSRYDELTPGNGFTSFVQEIKTYAYLYLPANFTSTYKKANFIYGDVNVNTYFSTTNFRVQNHGVGVSPRAAFDIDPMDTESVFADSSTLIKNFGDLNTILKLNNITIQVVIYNVLGLICLILAFIFINFIIKKEINETRRQLGIFKSFGYKTSELSVIFSIKTLITILIGMLIGWLVSFPVQIYMGQNFETSVVFSYQSIYFNPVLIVGIFLIIPGLFMLISYLITLKYLSESALSLISNGDRIAKHTPKLSFIARSLMKRGKGFSYRLRRSFVQRSKGKFTIVQILFGVSALLYTLMFGAEALMYQAIQQGFAVIKDGTDHEFEWKNRSELVINQTTDGKYSLSNLDDYDSAEKANKIDYIDYQGYANPSQAMLKDPNLQGTFSDARYRFRMLTDAMANSLTEENQNPDDTDNWLLLPTKIAEQKFAASVQPESDDLIKVNYFLYKLIIFKGLKQDNPTFNNWLQQMIVNNQPFGKNLAELSDPDWKLDEMWWNEGELLKIVLGAPDWEIPFKQSLFGMTTDFAKDGKELANNLFITDLSRILSMIFAEQSATNLLSQKLATMGEVDENGKYPQNLVDEALKAVYRETLTNPKSVLYHYDPRNETYWPALGNPLLNLDLGFSQTAANNQSGGGLTDLLETLPSSVLGLLTSAMMAKASPDLDDEAILNFNKFFYDSSAEHLQLLIDVLPTDDYDIGAMALQLDDIKNLHFGDPQKQYNFAGVSTSEYQKLTQDTGQENTFYGIVPYAVAKKLKLKKGDVLTVRSNTQSKVDIKIIVLGINKSITMPLSLTWNIMVDYSTFVEKMFSDELKDKMNFNLINDILQPYLFNSLLSQKPMLAGTFDLKNLPESLKTFKFVANNLTYNVEKGSSVLGGLFTQLLGTGNPLSNIFDRKEAKLDSEMNLVTNPMMLSEDKTSLVAVPYNIARSGVSNFTRMMVELMSIFMVLQSVLLTIILVVIMNIVVDEFAVVILTLRSLGYLQREINWIVMGSYVIGTIISWIIAYALSMILWKIFLIVAGNLWSIYIFLPFDWKALIVPILVLGSIMFVGWMASNYQVNRRSLTQITNFV